VTIDIGTGDGRAVLQAAGGAPATLAIGLDANAASMAESSRRASRAAAKGGLPNAIFLLAAAEAIPSELHGIADLVTVRFPWGSLLRGCLGRDERVAAGIVWLLAPGGELELLLAPAERDGLEGLATEPGAIEAAAADTFARFGLVLVEAREASIDEVRASRSTWARRLLAGGRSDRRPVTLIRMRSSAA
jgi:16S rRNA (adenine(1408)-N(1))-methyltransferase